MTKSIAEDIDAIYRRHGVEQVRDRARSIDRTNIPIFDSPAGGRRVDQPDATKPATWPRTPRDPHPLVFWESNPENPLD